MYVCLMNKHILCYVCTYVRMYVRVRMSRHASCCLFTLKLTILFGTRQRSHDAAEVRTLFPDEGKPGLSGRTTADELG